MSDTNHNLWRRGQFVLGPETIERLASWNRYEVGAGLHLSAHPALEVTQAGDDGTRLTLVGFILDPDHPSSSNDDILGHMAAVIGRGAPPNELTRRFGGCWLLIIANADDVRFFADPVGLQQTFHTGSAASGGMWAASEPGILAEILGFEISPEAREFMLSDAYAGDDEYWWPWDTTPYREIRRLPPNHELSARDGVVRRFWPDRGFTPCSPEEAAKVVGETLRGLIAAMHARSPLALTLTAGLDSRMVLAAAKPVARDVLVVTSKKRGMRDSDPDLVIARRLAASLGLQHQVIDSECLPRPEFRELYFSSNVLCHEKWVYGAQAILDALNLERTAVGGHIAEVVRCYYHDMKSGLDGSEAFTPELFAQAVGMGRQSFAVLAMERWKDGLGEIHNYDARDLLCWENDYGSWFPSSQQEFRMAWKQTFSPFNCRRVLETTLSVDPALRSGPDYPFFRNLIAGLWPECLRAPINPKPPVPWARLVRRGVRKIIRMIVR